MALDWGFGSFRCPPGGHLCWQHPPTGPGKAELSLLLNFVVAQATAPSDYCKLPNTMLHCTAQTPNAQLHPSPPQACLLMPCLRSSPLPSHLSSSTSVHCTCHAQRAGQSGRQIHVITHAVAPSTQGGPVSINVTGRHIAVTEALQQYVVRAQCVSDWYPANKLTHQRQNIASPGKAVLGVKRIQSGVVDG